MICKMEKQFRASLLGIMMILSIFSSLEAIPKVEVHGFIRIDGQVVSRLSVEDFGLTWPITPEIPFYGDRLNDHYQSTLDARITRIDVIAKDEICDFKISGKIEGDFYTTTGNALINNRLFRVRYAFCDILHSSGAYLRFGQADPLGKNPNCGNPINGKTLDFNGPAGSLGGFVPQIQIGYIHKLKNDMGRIEVMMDIEKKGTYKGLLVREVFPVSIDQGNGLRYPIFCTKVAWYGYKPFQAELSFSIGENRITFKDEQVTTSAWELETAFESRFGNFSFFGEANVTNGYNYLGYLDFPDIAINLYDDHDITSVRTAGGYLGVSWLWECANTVFYSMGGFHYGKEVKNSTFSAKARPPFVIQNPWQYLSSFQAGFIYTFLKDIDFGLEYKHWWCTGLNHKKGSLEVYSAMFVYNF